MLTCESPTAEKRIKCEGRFFGYDRGCELNRFYKTWYKNAMLGHTFKDTQYLSERFNISGHTTPHCDIESPLPPV